MSGDGWNEVSDEGKTFLKQLLQVDPKRRLTAGQALSHDWLTAGPTLDRRLSSINGLKRIASVTKQKKIPKLPESVASPTKIDKLEKTNITSKVTVEESS